VVRRLSKLLIRRAPLQPNGTGASEPLAKTKRDALGGTTPSATAIFTIVSANYIGFAATLMQSVRKHHPNAARFIILSDAYRDFPDIDLAAEVIACDELNIAFLDNMKLWYSVIEFNTAVKPFVFSYMFNDTEFSSAVYLDPDILLFSPLEEVYFALEDHSVVLTPHMMKSLQDGKEPSDLTIMKSGVYNLGFLGLKNDLDARNLVKWWSERLFAHCRVDIAGNMFTDQRWMDLAPVLVDKPYILRHPGYNVAYWNIVHRRVALTAEGDWTVDDAPLRFFHFSGIKPNDDSIFSKHQNRFTVENLGFVADLCAIYRAAVLANHWYEYSQVEYAFGKFPDGRPIADQMRKWILRAVDEGRLSANKSLDVGSAFFDEPDDKLFGDGGRLTRFAYQYWLDRPDLQHAFDLTHARGFEDYVGWFCGTSAEREGVAGLSIQAAKRLRDGVTADVAPVQVHAVTPPWSPVSSNSFHGPASEIETWLREDIEFEVAGAKVSLPKQAALLWERRIDLQQHFPLCTDPSQIDVFVAWVLTEGILGKSIAPDLLSSTFMHRLTTISEISLHYADVPITLGLILTRDCEQVRHGLGFWHRFPVDKNARAEHGFWFAYIAPRFFGWPEAFYAPVKNYFDSPSRMLVDGYPFTRGMLTLWELRNDLQRIFPMGSNESKWKYLRWLVFHAPRDYGVDVVLLCPGIADFLAVKSTRRPQITRLLELVYDERPDLQQAFDLSTPEAIAALLAWAGLNLRQYLIDMNLANLVGTSTLGTKAAEQVRVRVALTGHWEAASGIGEDLRCSVAALDACKYSDYVIVNLDSANVLDSNRTALATGTRIDADWNIIHRNADTSAEDWLTMRQMGISAGRVVGHWNWELDRLPAKWGHCFSYFDEVWGQSRFAWEAFAAEERRPTRLIKGAAMAPAVGRQVSRKQLGLSETATVFLFMFDFASFAARKNPQAAIRAFRLAFPAGDENVQLMIKTQNASKAPALWSELSALSDDRVIIKDARLTRDELISLVLTADAFVSLHRSEGYGRAPAEAMLLGRPVIVTGYSGTTDFACPDCACVVDFTLVPVQPHEYIGVEGQCWAEADVGHAAKFMRWVHECPDQAREMGKRGQRKAKKLLAPEKLGKAIIKVIEPPLTESSVDDPALSIAHYKGKEPGDRGKM
jgi:glycosyltransferase involved in cell wall biosynthesis